MENNSIIQDFNKNRDLKNHDFFPSYINQHGFYMCYGLLRLRNSLCTGIIRSNALLDIFCKKIKKIDLNQKN